MELPQRHAKRGEVMHITNIPLGEWEWEQL
jgi:hypothetical protein